MTSDLISAGRLRSSLPRFLFWQKPTGSCGLLVMGVFRRIFLAGKSYTQNLRRLQEQNG
jgi:hypothetical protein